MHGIHHILQKHAMEKENLADSWQSSDSSLGKDCNDLSPTDWDQGWFLFLVKLIK